MAGGLVKVHRGIADFGGFGEPLFAKSCIKLLDKAQHLMYVSICAIIGEESDGLSSLLEFLEPLGASP